MPNYPAIRAYPAKDSARCRACGSPNVDIQVRANADKPIGYRCRSCRRFTWPPRPENQRRRRDHNPTHRKDWKDETTAKRDSLRFFTTLYGDEPPGRILISTPSSNGTGWPTHACIRPGDAVHYTVGSIDVFHRVTLVSHKPKAGRGVAEDTSALTGLWLEVDVNGSPDGRGGTITDAAPDQEVALEFVQSVLVPTMLVISGYGIHAYWLFETPMLVTDDESRAAAKRLVRGWHARHQHEAREHDMPKFDSVFDLARVLRPVGSLNGKGDRPVPVELLDDGGPRYTTEALQSETLQVPDEKPLVTVPDLNGVPKRSVGDLLSQYPRLRKIVSRQGKPPGKGSDSEWDYALVCEAMRPPRGCSDAEAKALLIHNRAVNSDLKSKATRPDYVLRTVTRAREAVGSGKPDVTVSTEPAALISRYWNLGDDPIVSGQLVGDGSGAVVRLCRQSGRMIRIEHLRLLFDRASHNREVSIAARTRFKPLTGEQAVNVAQAVIAVCEAAQEDPIAETADLLETFAIEVAAIVDGVMHGESEARWTAIQEREIAERELRHHPDVARRTVAIRDESGRLWLPARAVRAAAQWKTWADLNSLVQEAGWESRNVDVHEPGMPRAAGAGHKRRKFYIEPQREAE